MKARKVGMESLYESDPGTVGQYRLHAALGQGGMGRVFLAAAPDGRLVALKQVRELFLTDEGFRARFRREVDASRRVSGAFTAPVVDADADAPVPWLASEFIAGPTLQQAIERTGPLPEQSVLRLAAGLATALADIHRAGLVHRDLKPSNILLTDDGLRVIDFGIARATDSKHTSRITHTGGVLGTPEFMSPEQAMSNTVTETGDVFALGSVLVMACTGQGPFSADAPLQAMYKVVNDEPRLDGLPDAVRRVAERCLVKDPAQRPGLGELLDMIGPIDPSARPWPEAVHELVAAQRTEANGFLAATGGRTLIDDGPTYRFSAQAGQPFTPGHAPAGAAWAPPDGPPLAYPPPPVYIPPPRRTAEGTRQAYIALAAIMAVIVVVAGIIVAAANAGDDSSSDGAFDDSGGEIVDPTEDPYYPDDTETTPEADPVAEAVAGDCFYNNGTMDDIELEPSSCDDWTFEVVAVVDGTTDTSECDDYDDAFWGVEYPEYDFVLCLKYLNGYGSAYNAAPGDCVYGPNEQGVAWEEVDCEVGNFEVLDRLSGTSDGDDCEDSWLFDQYFTYPDDDPDLEVVLCMTMNYPDAAGHAGKDDCLYRTGTDTEPRFESVSSCDEANVVVNGRTDEPEAVDFCNGWSSAWWEHYDFPELSYTICYYWL